MPKPVDEVGPLPVLRAPAALADFSTFAPGDMVKFEIVAVNAAGESAPSEPVSVTLPLAAAA